MHKINTRMTIYCKYHFYKPHIWHRLMNHLVYEMSEDSEKYLWEFSKVQTAIFVWSIVQNRTNNISKWWLRASWSIIKRTCSPWHFLQTCNMCFYPGLCQVKPISRQLVLAAVTALRWHKRDDPFFVCSQSASSASHFTFFASWKTSPTTQA